MILKNDGLQTKSLNSLSIKMITTAKGDLLEAPLEFTIEVLIRLLLKIIAKMQPPEPVDEWLLTDWLIVSLPLSVLLLIVWRIYVHERRLR